MAPSSSANSRILPSVSHPYTACLPRFYKPLQRIRQSVPVPQCRFSFRSHLADFSDFVSSIGELLRRQGLRAVAKRVYGIIMHLNHNAVRARCRCGHCKRLYQAAIPMHGWDPQRPEDASAPAASAPQRYQACFSYRSQRF